MWGFCLAKLLNISLNYSGVQRTPSAYFILMSSNLLMLCRGPGRGGKIVCLSSDHHFDFRCSELHSVGQWILNYVGDFMLELSSFVDLLKYCVYYFV